jgi:hypothetical protein
MQKKAVLFFFGPFRPSEPGNRPKLLLANPVGEPQFDAFAIQ